MVTEVAHLHIRENESPSFERAFYLAKQIISRMPGYIEHELLKCIEMENKYVLIVRWKKLEDHTYGFRQNAEYNEWKTLLHHFYEPFPVVEHYRKLS